MKIPNYDQLDAFTYCRLFTSSKKPDNAEWNGLKFAKVKKGKITEANDGEDNILSRAMVLKEKPVILKKRTVDLAEELVVVGPTTLNVVRRRNNIIDEQISVKDLNSNEEWMTRVKSEVCGVDFQNTTAELISQADLLANHLFFRMTRHLETRFTDTKYWSHWCFRWARRQFSRVALMSCMASHVKRDLEAMQEKRLSNFPHDEFICCCRARYGGNTRRSVRM